MNCLGRAIGLLAPFLVVPSLKAQPFPVPVPVPIAIAPVPGISINFAKARNNSLFTFSYNRGFGLVPNYGYGGIGPFGPISPIAPSFASTRFTQIVIQGPPIVLPPPAPPFFFPEDPPVRGPLAGRVMPMRPEEEPEVFPPVIEIPKDRNKVKQPDPPAPKKEEPPKKEVPPPPPPDPDRLLPRQPMNPDPRQESLRQLDLGKEAFERGEYGRAAERFRQASDLAPTSALPHFYLAQAQLAMGNHRRAFDILQVGLRLQPDWARQPFQPLALYGDHGNDYAEQIRLMEDLVLATPNDPVILFLAAYQLWFDGRREEARPLFERAAPAMPDPGMTERFLQALPGRDTL